MDSQEMNKQAADPQIMDARGKGGKGGAGWRLVVIVGIAALLCAVAAGAFFMQRAKAEERASGAADIAMSGAVGAAASAESNTAFLDAEETERVMAAARNIVTTVYSYNYDNIDGHADRIKPFMTVGMFEQYQELAPPNGEIVKQAKTTVQAAIPESGVGVVSLTGDDAVVDLLMAVEGDNDGVALLAAQVPLRLALQKVDGHWIAADILQM